MVVVLAVVLSVIDQSRGVAVSFARRVALRVLLIDDGTPEVEALAGGLALEGVPYTRLRLDDPNRPVITADVLASSAGGRYQAVVTGDAPRAMTAAEQSALTSYEATYGVRQVVPYAYPRGDLGLVDPSDSGYVGSLDGMRASMTSAGRAAGFGYLVGSIPLSVGGYGALSTPIDPATLDDGSTFTPFATMTIPGTSSQGVVLGVHAVGGVETLVSTMAMNGEQTQFTLLVHGIITWLTRGVHFGLSRNYLTFHADDAFSADSRWDPSVHCTPGEDCPPGTDAAPVDLRMTAEDVAALASWQRVNDYIVTLPFNGYYALYDDDGLPRAGGDPLINAFVAHKDEFRWLNHGYEHLYQGCVQDVTVVPWRCETSDAGILWTPEATIAAEIAQNLAAAADLGLHIDPTEYLSGEHSGLTALPQQPVDNPNFVAAVEQAGLATIGADSSRESAQRIVGSARTVPRHPMSIFYNVADAADEVSEYNWIYTRSDQGGSGYCERNSATTTCLPAPLDPAVGFADYILPTEVAEDLRDVLSNDPRPLYAHVSNLVGPDRLALTVLSSILSTYRSMIDESAPPVNLTLTEAGDVLAKQAAWSTAGMPEDSAVTGYVQDDAVVITNDGPVAAPVTLPPDARSVTGQAFGDAYGGERSGWVGGSRVLRFGPPLGTPRAEYRASRGSVRTHRAGHGPAPSHGR